MRRAFGAAALMVAVAAAPADPLSRWPAAARAPIARTIAAAPPGSYATFDADNTLWRHDLEEALLPWLEHRGLLDAPRLDPSLRPVPLEAGESLYGYYLRLCAIDDKLCYPWIAQAFAGLSLAVLKREVDAMMASTAPIPVRYRDGDRIVDGTVHAPVILPAQRQLVAALRAAGVRVYVVTASLEELVRMVVSDPRYGLGIAPQDVIGVTAVLRDPASGAITTARQQIAAGHFLDPVYPARRHAGMTLTATLWTPLTWQEGKVAAIQAYIDPLRRPVLAAGDSRSDWPMLFYTAGTRIWVEKGSPPTATLAARRTALAEQARRLGDGYAPAPDAGWVAVTQDDLQAPAPQAK